MAKIHADAAIFAEIEFTALLHRFTLQHNFTYFRLPK